MLFAALMLSAVLSADPVPAGAGCPAELFRIARSKNANVVVYEAKAGPAAGVSPGDRVTATWLLLAGDGRREGLSFFERAFAYGFDARAAASGPGVWFTLHALKDRVIRLADQGGCPVAFSEVGGRDAQLKRIYVKASDGQLVPSVEYVELFGVDPASGRELYEKVFPGKR